MLERFQVKNLSDIIDENTKLIIDSDGIAFKPASIVDEMYIDVTHLPTGKVKEFKNVTEFKGNVRGVGKIGSGSWLDSVNITRMAAGQKPFPLEDFSIAYKTRQRLPLSTATKAIDMHIAAIQDVVGIKDYTLILGSGECFRHKLLLPEQYKSNRDEKPRPSQLGNCRQHMIENHPSKLIQDGIHEADDVVSMYSYRGYLDYLKTGKFSYLVASNDKDERGTPGLLFDWTKEGDSFSHCKTPFLIDGTNKGIGGCDLDKGKIKALGFTNMIYQLICGDTSDYYDPRSVCGKKKSDNFGDSSVYLELVKMKTPQDLLNFTISKYSEWYPDGLHFTAWEGTKVDEDVEWWLNQMFAAAYMKRSKSDKVTFTDICNKFGVKINK